jgi:hypothetical protein
MTRRQQNFVQEYLIDLNGRAAAERAGYSARSASLQAHRLLSREDIQLALQQDIEERRARSTLSQDYALEKLREILDDKFLQNHQKIGALKLLMTHLGMFPAQKISHDIDIKMAERRRIIDDIAPEYVYMDAEGNVVGTKNAFIV